MRHYTKIFEAFLDKGNWKLNNNLFKGKEGKARQGKARQDKARQDVLSLHQNWIHIEEHILTWRNAYKPTRVTQDFIETKHYKYELFEIYWLKLPDQTPWTTYKCEFEWGMNSLWIQPREGQFYVIKYKA